MTQSLSILLKPEPPWVLKSTTTIEVISKQAEVVLQPLERVKILILDGGSMETGEAFYDEAIRGLHLPAYFGRNYDALDECLRDLDWLSGAGFVLLISQAEKVLRLKSTDAFDGFLSVLNRAGEEWSCSVEDGEVWDRPPRPFHAVFLCKSSEWRKDVPLLQLMPI